MKFTNEKGFTLIELLIGVLLFSFLGITIAKYLGNSISESNKLKNKVATQNSVTALMNKIELTIKEANIPVVTENKSDKFTINSKNGDTKFYLEANEKKVKVKNDIDNRTTIYENIESVVIEEIGDSGVKIVISGLDNEYVLRGEYYAQNTEIGLATYTVNHIIDDEETEQIHKNAIINKKINILDEVKNDGKYEKANISAIEYVVDGIAILEEDLTKLIDKKIVLTNDKKIVINILYTTKYSK